MKLVFILLMLFIPLIGRGQTVFTLNIQEKAGINHYFWKAAGHDFMFQMTDDDAGKYLLSRISSYNSIKYIRSHFTFNSDDKGGQIVVYDPDGKYHYDFSKINHTFQNYLTHGIKPIVEFDFFPDNFAKPLGNDTNNEGFTGKNAQPRDWLEWEQLMRAFMENLIETFGKEELKTWYYEVWNEPDNWPTEHLHIFFRLYDTFADVVKSYDQDFKGGGPATYNLYALKAFLDHVTSGTNFVTGEVGSPIDFISHHIYGLSGGWLHAPPEIVPQVSRFSQELHWIKRLLDKYESIKDIDFHLNEWGVCSNFQKAQAQYPQLEYRNNEFSPLFMTKLIDCLYALEDNYDFKTSMLLYWGFSWEDQKNEMFTGNRELTTGGHTPKPILTGFELLAKLQPERLKAIDNVPGDRLGIIPTIGSKELAFIVYNFNETDDDLSKTDQLRIDVNGLIPNTEYQTKIYKLNREYNNSYAKWLKIGSPSVPGRLPADWSAKVSNLELENEIIISDHSGTLSFNVVLSRHSMNLYTIDLTL